MLLVLSTLLLSFVSAVPGQPNQFFGTMTVNGAPAADNLIVSAQIAGDEVAATTTHDGKYGYGDDLFFITDQVGDRNGDTITFFLRDANAVYHEAGTAVFENGAITRLDLVVTGAVTKPKPPKKTGGSGSSSGSSFTPSFTDSSNETNTTVNDDSKDAIDVVFTDDSDSECTPQWDCTSWLDCVGGKQKRVCVDTNACGVEPSESETVQACEPVELETAPAKENIFSSLTGAVVGGGVATWASLLALIVIIVGLVMLARNRK